MIDAHVHFWRLDRGDYGWLTPERALILRDFLPEDFHTTVRNTPVDRVIAVQAAPTEAETNWLLAQAKRHTWIAGVTGWIDLAGTDPARALARLSRQPCLVGIRSMEGVRRDARWLAGPEHAAGIAAVAEHGLVFEALLLPHHLSALAEIAQRHPDMPIIVNHAAKPMSEAMTGWDADIAAFATLRNVSCKLSGLTAQSGDPNINLRIASRLIEVFGPGRLIWGSDHPVLLETCDYDSWLALTDRMLSDLDPSARAGVEGGNAARIYRLKQRGLNGTA